MSQESTVYRQEIEPGLCALCRHVRVIRSDRGSLFYQCQLSRTHPDFPPYPRLPVRSCRGFEPAESSAGHQQP